MSEDDFNMREACVAFLNNADPAVMFNPSEIFCAGWRAARATAPWQPIETAPSNVEVLLFCPDRGVSNPARIELGYASHGWKNDVASTISHHSWATHWMPLPSAPRVPTWKATP